MPGSCVPPQLGHLSTLGNRRRVDAGMRRPHRGKVLFSFIRRVNPGSDDRPGANCDQKADVLESIETGNGIEMRRLHAVDPAKRCSISL